MNIITQTNLSGEKEVIYTDPVTEKEIKIYCDDFNAGVIEARKTALTNASVHLYVQFDKYYTDLLKFADIKGKALNSIRQARLSLEEGMIKIYNFDTIEDLAAHIYENIFPYLATCTIKSDRYFKILQSVANQSLKFSVNHQLEGANVYFVKS